MIVDWNLLKITKKHIKVDFPVLSSCFLLSVKKYSGTRELKKMLSQSNKGISSDLC